MEYGGFCTCTVGLVIVYWKKQLCIEKIKYKGVGPLSGVFGPYLKTYNL
jgi:hypothetical protein